MKKRWSCMIMALLLLLAGCSAKETAVKPQEERMPQKEYELIFVCPFTDHEYWQSCIAGMAQADELIGTRTSVLAPDTSSDFAAELVVNMQKAIDKKPDGIIVYAGIEELAPLIEEAQEQGIPVLAIDSDAPKTPRIAYMGTDEYDLGHTAGEYIIANAGDGASVGVLVSSLAAQKELEVIAAFSDTVSDYGIRLVAMEETEADIETAEKKTRQMLLAHPEITAMFNTTSSSVTGAARAKQALGRDDLVLVGFDDTEENLKFLREGVINAIFVQKIFDEGRQSVYLMKEYLDNGSLSKTVYKLDAELVTGENADTYDTPFVFDGTAKKEVRVGYYTGSTALQAGFSDDARKTGYAYEYYRAIAGITGWNYTYVYGTREEIFSMLRRGEVDIAAGAYKSEALGGKVLYSKDDMGLSGIRQYFAVNRRRQDLADELDYAMEQIKSTSPDYEIELFRKYYGSTTEQMLNAAEAAWLKDNGKIKLGYTKNNLPLSDADENGSPIGMVKELMGMLENSICVEIEPVCFESVQAMETALGSGEIDVAFPMYLDLWLAEKKQFLETDAIISDRVMILYKGAYTPELLSRVALPRSDIGIRYYLEDMYPETTVVTYDTRQEALEAVLSGKETCTIGASSIMQRILMEKTAYKELQVAYLDISENFGMAVRQEECLLLSILNKEIAQMDSAGITSAMVKYSEVEPSYSFGDFVRKNAFPVFAFLLGVLAVLLFVFAAYMQKNYKFNLEMARKQSDLEDAIEQANAASEAKTSFLSNMSHDIRTPMNAVVGMTAIAKQNIDNRERVIDCLEKIDLSSQHLLTLINNILDISKIESRQLQITPSNFSLKKAVHGLVQIMQPQIISKHMEFECNIPPLAYEWVCGDEVRIKQIFINLLSNAVKYTPEGGKILLDLREQPSEDKKSVHIIYSVLDNGIGMSEEFMKTMYDTFSRAEDSRVDKIQGTGLGLAIVRQMVDLMDGTIHCYSEEGKGTKFVVELELPVADEEEVKKVQPSAIRGADKSFVKGAHILIAEDNDINWEVITGILEMFDVTADRAENGKICLAKLRASVPGTYDLVLMDVQMPVMNGREATIEIRRDVRGDIRDIPIIAMTADAFAEDIMSCLAAGMNGHVSKPVDINILLQEMKKVLPDRKI